MPAVIDSRFLQNTVGRAQLSNLSRSSDLKTPRDVERFLRTLSAVLVLASKAWCTRGMEETPSLSEGLSFLSALSSTVLHSLVSKHPALECSSAVNNAIIEP